MNVSALYTRKSVAGPPVDPRHVYNIFNARVKFMLGGSKALTAQRTAVLMHTDACPQDLVTAATAVSAWLWRL